MAALLPPALPRHGLGFALGNLVGTVADAALVASADLVFPFELAELLPGGRAAAYANGNPPAPAES